MENVYKCPPDIWRGFTDEEKALWCAIFLDMKLPTYMPDGVRLARGHTGEIARNLATRLVWSVHKHKEKFSDVLSSLRA